MHKLVKYQQDFKNMTLKASYQMPKYIIWQGLFYTSILITVQISHITNLSLKSTPGNKQNNDLVLLITLFIY